MAATMLLKAAREAIYRAMVNDGEAMDALRVVMGHAEFTGPGETL